MAGSRAGAARCGECPLDAADKVEDALAASQPQDFGGLDPEHLPEEAVGPWMAQADQDAMLDALARHMAQELDVNVDRARVSLQRLLAKGLLQLKVDPA